MSPRILFCIVILCLTTSVIFAQNTVPTFSESESIKKRFEWFDLVRTPPGKVLDDDARWRAIDHMRRMEKSKLGESVQEAQPQWMPSGPYTTGGRVKSILPHPTKKNTIYIGTASGGVWVTDDAGLTWKPIMDDANAIAFGSLCFDPSNTDVIYAGTGEQVSGSNTLLGCGLLRSEDAGATWQIVGLTQVGSFSRIYCHPKNPNLLMASCMNGNAGVYRSLDRGVSWTKLASGNVYDMTINPTDENEWFITVDEYGVMYSDDMGDSWRPKNTGIIGTVGRFSITQSPTNPDRLYVLAQLNGLASIFHTTDRGETWTAGYEDSRGCFFDGSCTPPGQGSYDNYITISPTNPDVCFAGGIDIWKTTNGGTSWSNLTGGYSDGNGSNVVHVDQHCMAYDPFSPNTVYAGCDGGMVKSNDAGINWFSINEGLAISQFYAFDIDPTDENKAYGGTQDNGTLWSQANVGWDTLWGGDGMVTIVNYNNPNIVYGNTQRGNPFRVNFGNNTGRYVTDGIDMGESALWVAPMVMSPADDLTLLHGRQRVWRTYDGGDFWYETSPPFVNNVAAIEMSPADPAVIWAASSTGDIMLAEDDGFEWRKANRSSLTNRYISDIECSRVDRETAWISYGTYGDPNVWKTTDLGETWTSLWDGMPDVAVSSIKVHPDDENILFIGTDVGVFASYNGGRNWVPYGKGLPRTPVFDIRISSTFGFIQCVTYGRSAWKAPLISVAPSEPAITAPSGGELFTGTLNTVISWSGFTAPVKLEYSVDDGATWKDVAKDVVGSALNWRVPNWPTVVARIKITSQTDTSQSEISRTFTIQPLEKGGVLQKKSVPWVPYGLSWDGKNSLWSTSFYERKLYRLNATTLQVERTVELPASAGDSLFTDLTIDRSTGTMYIHKLLASDGVGATVIVADTNGNVIRTFPSQARRYATGLEFVNGQLIANERDGFRHTYVMDLDGVLIDEKPNAYQFNYGPRCLAYDDNGLLYQTCTYFPNTNAALTECYAITIPVTSLSTEQDRMPLNTAGGLINARAIEYDRSDKNMWIGDFSGNIYKITGFSFVAPPVSSVEADPILRGDLSIRPNPSSTSAVITLGATTIDRRVEISIIDMLGREVLPSTTQMQGAGVELSSRITTAMLSQGTYTAIASVSGTVISSSRFIVNH